MTTEASDWSELRKRPPPKEYRQILEAKKDKEIELPSHPSSSNTELPVF